MSGTWIVREESIRLYLLGKKALPENIAVQLFTAQDALTQEAARFYPYLTKRPSASLVDPNRPVTQGNANSVPVLALVN